MNRFNLGRKSRGLDEKENRRVTVVDHGSQRGNGFDL